MPHYNSILDNLLDSGRLKKKFRNIEKIGQGGFGSVYKAIYHVDQKQYAIKVVRLHIKKKQSLDPMTEIYHHKVYRELQAASRILTSENIVRYFNSWFEELDLNEKNAEYEYKQKYLEVLKRRQDQAAKRRAKRKAMIKENSSNDDGTF